MSQKTYEDIVEQATREIIDIIPGPLTHEAFTKIRLLVRQACFETRIKKAEEQR